MNRLKFLVLFLIAEAAIAYTLPLDFILAEMAKSRLLLNTAKLQATILKNGEASFVDFVKPGHWPELLNPVGQGALAARAYLSKVGVDLTTVSQGLFANEPVFIIGAHPTNYYAPQIWIDKTTFLPVKEITHGRVVTFEKWTASEFLPGKKFPRIVKTSVGDTVETMSVSEKSY